MIGAQMFLSFEEKQKRTPKNHGHWTGVRGNSKFYTDKEEIKNIGAKYVKYINGEPDFTRFSRYIITIESMTNDRLKYSEYFKSNYRSRRNISF